MRAIGTKNAWFEFKGQRNTEFGVQMLSMPTRPHPARKGELLDIPGVDGKLFLDEGAYDRILVSLRCVAVDNDNIDSISVWLSGEGELIFGDEPDRAYKARITKEYSRSNRTPRLRGQEFTITFDCEPYRYKVGDAFETPQRLVYHPSDGLSFDIENVGTVKAMPLIEVNSKNSGGSITIGEKTLTFGYCKDTLYIDCGAKIAYTKNADGSIAFASVYVSGDWLELQPGNNEVIIKPAEIVSNYITVKISARWRYL